MFKGGKWLPSGCGQIIRKTRLENSVEGSKALVFCGVFLGPGGCFATIAFSYSANLPVKIEWN
jgi:hypothetical protein